MKQQLIVGQVWEEIAIKRLITIIGFDRHGNVRTKCVRQGVAKRGRFNGKRGGYRLVGEISAEYQKFFRESN